MLTTRTQSLVFNKSKPNEQNFSVDQMKKRKWEPRQKKLENNNKKQKWTKNNHKSNDLEDIPKISTMILKAPEPKWEAKGAYVLNKNEAEENLITLQPTIGRLWYQTVTIQDIITVQALVDTGAQVSIIKQSIWEELTKRSTVHKLSSKMYKVKYANNQTELAYVAELELRWKDKQTHHVVLIVENLSADMIIGLDLLNKWPILSYPSISNEELQSQLSKVKLADLNNIIQQKDQTIEYHVDRERLLQHIQLAIADNLATTNQHSTIGQVEIEFKIPSDRQKGV